MKIFEITVLISVYWLASFPNHRHRHNRCDSLMPSANKINKILLSTHVQAAERAELQEREEIRTIVLVWKAKRGNEGEQDTHLGVVY